MDQDFRGWAPDVPKQTFVIMTEDIQINLSISAIQERRFVLMPLEEMLPGNFSGRMEIDHLITTEIDEACHQMTVDAGIRYKMDCQVICELVVAVVFIIEPFKAMVRIDPEQRVITFSADFVPTLLNTAYGTLRGVLAEKTKDTNLANYPLQLSPIEELIKMNRFKVKE